MDIQNLDPENFPIQMKPGNLQASPEIYNTEYIPITFRDLFDTADLINLIFEWLPSGSLLKVAQVNKMFNVWAVKQAVERLNTGKATLKDLGYDPFENAIPFLAANIYSIKKLDLTAYLCNITDEIINKFISMCTGAESANNFSNLQEIRIESILISDNGLVQLAKNCTNLQSLNVLGSWRITDSGSSTLKSLIPHLKILRQLPSPPKPLKPIRSPERSRRVRHFRIIPSTKNKEH